MIRRMKSEDLEQVITLERQIFSHPWSEQSMLSAMQQEGTIYLVDVAEEGIRGYLGIWCMTEDGDLCNMAVTETARRKGVASGLLQRGMTCCREQGVRRILLEVRESNLPARQLYERHGFTQIGMRKRYYTAPVEDAILMECQL